MPGFDGRPRVARLGAGEEEEEEFFRGAGLFRIIRRNRGIASTFVAWKFLLEISGF